MRNEYIASTIVRREKKNLSSWTTRHWHLVTCVMSSSQTKANPCHNGFGTISTPFEIYNVLCNSLKSIFRANWKAVEACLLQMHKQTVCCKLINVYWDKTLVISAVNCTVVVLNTAEILRCQRPLFASYSPVCSPQSSECQTGDAVLL